MHKMMIKQAGYPACFFLGTPGMASVRRYKSVRMASDR